MRGGARSVSGTQGVVTSVEAQASRAGAAILRAGGNAIDAAVAIGYALAVTHPSAGNIGGGGFMLVRFRGKPTVAVDFRETAPGALTQAAFDRMIDGGARGPGAVGIPGSVAGLELAHRRWGQLPRARVLEPAIRLAREGYVLGPRQATVLGWSWPKLRADAGARALWGAGAPPRAGARLKNADLARVLERIAERGAAGFYEGETAAALVAALAPAGVTLDDLRSYRAVEREPLRVDYRGLTVETMPPPSAGGVTLVLLLEMLEQLEAYELPRDGADWAHLFVEASKRAQAERRFAVSDPDVWPSGELPQRVSRWQRGGDWLTRIPVDRARATPAADVHPNYAAALRELPHTTHFSVVDAQGNVVSCTMTLSASFGARLVARGTGIVLNNSVASFATTGENRPRGGRRTVSSMSPTLVLRGAAPILVLGSPGGDTIPSTLAQVLTRLVDDGAPLDAAIDAPRLHHGFVPDRVRYEGPRPPARTLLTALRQRGHQLQKGGTMGDANDIALDGDTAYAYADPREGGLAIAVDGAAPTEAPR